MTDSRESRYRKLYDLSLDDYEKMLISQDGVCAICGNPPKKVRLSVDHNHKTGEVRGLLCMSCNMRLGERITAEWLYNAYYYLTNPPVVEALDRIPVGVTGRVTSKRKRKRKY